MDVLCDIELAAEPNAVAASRNAVSDATAGLPFDHLAIALAVSEAVANVVRHAYAGEGLVFVLVEIADDDLAISVQDQGAGFLPAEQPGVGLGLIHNLTNRLSIESGLGGTLVHMVFQPVVTDG